MTANKEEDAQDLSTLFDTDGIIVISRDIELVNESGKMSIRYPQTCAGMISTALPSMLLREILWHDIFKYYWTPSGEIPKAQFPGGFLDWIVSVKKEVAIPKHFVDEWKTVPQSEVFVLVYIMKMVASTKKLVILVAK